MEKAFTLTPNEYSIVSAMWDAGHSLSRNEIMEACKDAKWKSNSVHILLNQLLDKGAIIVDGFKRTGKNYGRTYAPTVTKEEYDLMQLNRVVVEQRPEKSVLAKFAAGFIGGEDVDMDVLNDLEKMIQSRKEELK